MENASKALIMAGGILVGVLVLSLMVYLFADFSRTAADINSQNEQQRIVEFNSKFTTYDTYKDKDGNWQITIYDIISLAGYAKENNDYYSESPDEQISVNIQSSPKTNNVQEHLNEYTKIISNYAYTANGNLKKFSCESIEYNSNGKVKAINFKTIS